MFPQHHPTHGRFEDLHLLMALVVRQHANKLLTVKKEALPDLGARFREQSLRYEEAAKAREQKQKADDLKKELAWSHVATEEEEMTQKIEEGAKLGRRLPKIEENIQEVQEAFDAATAQLQTEMRTSKNKLTEYNSDIKQINVSLQATKNQFEELTQQIAAESRRMAVYTQAKHEETLNSALDRSCQR